MKDRVGFMRRPIPVRVMIFSLMVALVCLAGGCGAEPKPATGPSEIPEGAKNTRDYMKQKAAAAKAGTGKVQRTAR
jgi:hypothetical protein